MAQVYGREQGALPAYGRIYGLNQIKETAKRKKKNGKYKEKNVWEMLFQKNLDKS
jgi:hypothetical protein